MRAPLLALTLALGSSCSAHSDEEPRKEKLPIDAPGSPKALACQGTSRDVNVEANGQFHHSERPVRRTYVFDDTRRTIYSQTEREEGSGGFYEFCDTVVNCTVEVTPQNIRGVMVDGPGGVFDDRRREITLDRNSGRIIDTLRIRNEDGRESLTNEEYACTHAEVPLTYRERVGPPRF